MAETRQSGPLDPAADSALLLRRIGFFTLGVALPVAAMLSRRAAVVLVPIGVALLVIAALLIESERFFRSLRRRAMKATALALALFIGWATLSGLWTPRGASGSERLLNMAFALALGVLAVASLPERMRAANINPIAIGVGSAAILGALFALTGIGLGDAEDDLTVIQRGLALVIVLVWPALGWLLLRGRNRGAIALLGTTVIAAGAIYAGPSLAAVAAGAGVFALVVSRGPAGVRLSAGLAAGLILIAPLAALLLADVIPGATGEALATWRAIIAAEPMRLVTGFGFDAMSAQAVAGWFPGGAPTSVLFAVWHELGVIGALAFAAALWFAMRAVLVLPPVLQAGAIAAYAAAFTLGVAGFAPLRAWWLMTLVAIVVLTTAIARGQGRTDRPLVRFVRAADSRPVVPAKAVAGAAAPDAGANQAAG
jgi:hypothetical protein